MNIAIWARLMTKMFRDGEVIIETISPDGKYPEANEKAIGVSKAFHPIGSSINVELVGDPCQYGFIPEAIGEGLIKGKTSSPLGLERNIRLA